ncbi:MAG TPA: hypothetical protein VEV17_27075 [Bryobacteraceae bacterium]|nr:hypothetical protein [Bryobacteraceae bacterium]
MFVEFGEGGGVLEIALTALEALGLALAELLERFLELAGEALAMQAEHGESAMRVDDVERDGGLLRWQDERRGGADRLRGWECG